MNEVERFLVAARNTLRGGGLTPLQVDEIKEAIEAHENCHLIDNAALQDQRNRIENHWMTISSTMTRHGTTQHVVRLFAHSFAGLLLEEYYKMTPRFRLVPLQYYLGILGTAKERQEAANVLTGGDISQLDPLYEKTIAFSITELVLDREHVELRLRNAASGESLTEGLLQSGSDAKLREVIDKDLASFRQIVMFRPEHEDAQYCVDSMAQSMLRQLQTVPSTPGKVSTFLATMGSIWGSSGTPQRLKKSLSSAHLLLSDDELAKKTI